MDEKMNASQNALHDDYVDTHEDDEIKEIQKSAVKRERKSPEVKYTYINDTI